MSDDDESTLPQPPPDGEGRSSRWQVIVAVIAGVALVAAAVLVGLALLDDDEPSSYDDVESTFLDTCEDSAPERISEPREFCGCYFAAIKDEFSFDRFVRLDEEVRENPDEIPDELLVLQEDCELEVTTATTVPAPPSTTTPPSTVSPTTAPL